MPHNKEVIDTTHAIELAECIWWVGNYLEDDLFQCHSYLIEHGDQSVLIDPGSLLTFPATRAKIEEVIPFDNIRYFICHHQDPDITASLPLLDSLITRGDAVIVSHWRAVALLRHYDLKTPFWNIEDHNWQLDLGDRRLSFVLTPYLHFPGAFCTYDTFSKTLFSSDIFGGFTENWSLYAHDESYLDSIRAFHEHYMPSREILQHTMEKFDLMDIDIIAPQHGSMIPKPLIKFMINKLKSMECGLFMNSDQGDSTRRLHEINQMLAEAASSIANARNFREVAEEFLSIIAHELPVNNIEFRIREGHHQQLHFTTANKYKGTLIPINATDEAMFQEAAQLPVGSLGCKKIIQHTTGAAAILVPLHIRENDEKVGVAILKVGIDANINNALLASLDQVCGPVAAALEREAIFLRMEQERNVIYERSIRDGLTGLYTKSYMSSVADRLIHTHDRIAEASIGLIFIDIDYFKTVNDTYGHLIGDEVLRNCGQAILNTLRPMDIPIRFGGEELLAFVPSSDGLNLKALTERLRQNIHRQKVVLDTGGMVQITVSAGIALHRQGENLTRFIDRADQALYQAKAAGRNHPCVADESIP